MKLYYFHAQNRNFGDDLNAWIWDKLLPDVFDQNEDVRVSVIGTIIGNKMSPSSHWIVMGSGVGYQPNPSEEVKARWNVLCVRGPLSAEILGLSPNKVVTDSALCLSLLPEYAPINEEKRSGIVFMPHHAALEEGRWKEACELAGIEFISAESDDRETLKRLQSARLVLADAMHAAIVADTLRVPWIPLVTSSQINTFKYLDWTMSMNVPYNPIRLPSSPRTEAFKSRWLPLRGEGFFVPDGTKDKAMRNLRHIQTLKRKEWWPLYRKVSGLVFHGGLAVLDIVDALQKIWFRRVLRKKQGPDHYLLRATEGLRNAAMTQAYLSSDEVFETKKAQMAQCLQEIKDLATPKAD